MGFDIIAINLCEASVDEVLSSVYVARRNRLSVGLATKCGFYLLN